MNPRLMIQPTLLNFFLDAYLTERKPTWEAPTQTVLQVIESGRNWLFNTPKLNPVELEEQCEVLKQRFSQAHHAAEWINVILDLEKGASARQQLQVMSESLFSDTLHAIRSLIVAKLQDQAGPYYHDYKQYIDKLLVEKKSLKDKIYQKQLKGMPIKGENQELSATLIKLAALGHSKSIFIGQERGILGGFRLPLAGSDANPYFPECYDARYYVKFYKGHHLGRSSDDFISFEQEIVSRLPSGDNATEVPRSPTPTVNSAEAALVALPEVALKLEGCNIPSLNPQVLTAFMDEYLACRQHLWNSKSGRVVESFKTIAAPLLGAGQSPAQIHENCERLKQRFKTACNMKDWLGLVTELVALAEAAQQNRVPGYNRDDSLFCRTLHAVRSYIIAEISKDESSPAFHALQYTINELLVMKKVLKDKIYQQQLQGRDVITENAELDHTLIQLAALGHMRSAFAAQSRGAFRNLNKPTDGHGALEYSDESHPFSNLNNPYLPCCFQRKWHVGFYNRHIYQRRDYQAFDDFEQIAKQGRHIPATAETTVTDPSVGQRSAVAAALRRS